MKINKIGKLLAFSFLTAFSITPVRKMRWTRLITTRITRQMLLLSF